MNKLKPYYITPTKGKIRPTAIIASSLGIHVGDISRDTLKGADGRAYIIEEKPYIMIAKELPIEEKRLTLTHELAHFYLGHLLGRTDEQFKVSHSQEEFEAEALGFILYNFFYGIDGGRKQDE